MFFGNYSFKHYQKVYDHLFFLFTFWFVFRLDSNPSSFCNDFLAECIQWLCSEEKTAHLSLLFEEQFPSPNRLVLFLAEHYLHLPREQEMILKYLFKQSQTSTTYTNLSVLIFCFSLYSSHRSIRSTTLKILQTKLQCSTNDFDDLIQSIKHHQHEILTDPEYICYLITQLIQAIKLTEKKKRKLNVDQSSLIHLLKQTINENDQLTSKLKQQLNIQLLYLLKQCKHWSIFDQYRTDLETLLHLPQAEQNQDNQIFMENVIQHIDYETLIHEQSLCFETILQILRRSIKKSKAVFTIDMMILTLKQVRC